MKTFATNEKKSLSAAGKTHPYVHRPVRRGMQVQQAEIHRILRSTGAQARLTIGQPNDRYEQEADRVADQVMRMSDADVAQRAQTAKIQPIHIQRMCPECEEETAQRQPEEEEESVQTKLNTGILQRQEDNEEDELVLTKQRAGETQQVSPAFESQINSLKSGGQSLDKETRNFFEPRFGKDFSGVRIHQNRHAADVSRSINARAFTLGNNVVFGSGQYQPHSWEGRQLLGHELTHVVQQNGENTSLTNLNPASQKIIQRAQIGGIQTSGSQSYFIYELDNLHTFSQLANYYGTSVPEIEAINPGLNANKLRLGQKVKVPAINPPTDSSTSWVRVRVHNTSTVPIAVRWNSGSRDNIVGRITRGTLIWSDLTTGNSLIAISDLINIYQGIFNELVIRDLASQGSGVIGFVPTANIRFINARVSAADVNLIARMIWGEQRSQGDDAMIAAAWIAKNRYDSGWGSYPAIITVGQFHGLATQSKVTGLTGSDLQAWNKAQRIAQDVVNGTLADPTGGVVYFGNEYPGTKVLQKMRSCSRRNPAFSFRKISGTNFYYCNGDYTSTNCTIP